MENERLININPYNRARLRKAVVDEIANGKANFNCAVTLTFPMRIWDRSKAQKSCKKFRNKYNKVLGFDKNHERHAKRDKQMSAPFAAFIEGDGKEKHFHYHIAMHRPANYSLHEYEQLIKQLWEEALQVEKALITVKDVYDCGWAEYMTKEFTTGDADAIDDMNYNVF